MRIETAIDDAQQRSEMDQVEHGLASPAARAVDLAKSYGTGGAVVRALDGVSVAFDRARFTAVMGPSGSGKSTLMHCMAGLDVPTSGRAFVGDDEIGRLDDAGLTEPSARPGRFRVSVVQLGPDADGGRQHHPSG